VSARKGVFGLLAALIVGLVAAQAASSSPTVRLLVLHLKFHHVETGGLDIAGRLGSGPYMLVLTDGPPFLMFDYADGKQWLVGPRRCQNAMPVNYPGPGSFGAPWVMFSCQNGGWALYNVVSRRWKRLADSLFYAPVLEGFQVGSRWIEIRYDAGVDCGDHIHSCGEYDRFYEIATGRIRPSPRSSSTSRIDLDSRYLVRPLCRPLQSPSLGPLGPTGTLALYGQFALRFTGWPIPFFDNAAPEGASGGWTLQRCGSNQQIPIDTEGEPTAFGGLTANDHAVLWSVVDGNGLWRGRIAGRFLPSLRPFVAQIPQRLVINTDEPVLDNGRIYVDASDGLWWAAFPKSTSSH
jgi:hypothetical protein